MYNILMILKPQGCLPQCIKRWTTFCSAPTSLILTWAKSVMHTSSGSRCGLPSPYADSVAANGSCYCNSNAASSSPWVTRSVSIDPDWAAREQACTGAPMESGFSIGAHAEKEGPGAPVEDPRKPGSGLLCAGKYNVILIIKQKKKKI